MSEEQRPEGSEPAEGGLGWVLREKRDRSGQLVDCFVEAPRAEGMAYGLEVLGDDYTGYGDVEGKRKHCEFIVALANAVGDPDALTKAVQDVLSERRSQVHKGFDAEHDAEIGHCAIASAAAAYAAWDGSAVRGARAQALWPGDIEEFKPAGDDLQGLRRNYIRAAAMLLAAAEVIDSRAADRPVSSTGVLV